MGKLTEIRLAVLTAIADRPDTFNPTNTGKRALQWLCQNGLAETTTNNPTAALVFRITDAGRSALAQVKQ